MKASNGLKVCSHCRKNLLVSEYHKNKHTHDGFNNQCKICIAEIRERRKEKKHEYDKKYSLDNSEKKRQKASEWYLKNHEHGLETRRLYHQNHKKEHTERAKIWRKNNPEKVREIHGRQKAKRREMGFIKLFKNPFPTDVQIDWHHVNGLLVVPIPRKIHNKCSHLNPEEHRERCNVWLYYLYGMDISKLLE
jgi:hypothetical protein